MNATYLLIFGKKFEKKTKESEEYGINKDNKLKVQNNENNVSIKSSIASNNSKDINQEINSYLLKKHIIIKV